MSEKLISIENTTDTAYRFTPVLKFIPGQITKITEKEYNYKPMIKTLIEKGIFRVVGEEGAGNEEVVEEV